MLFLAQTEFAPGRSFDDLSPILSAEKHMVGDLISHGIVKSAFLRTDKFGAILLMEAENAATASDVLHTLPAYIGGVIVLKDLIPIEVADLS